MQLTYRGINYRAAKADIAPETTKGDRKPKKFSPTLSQRIFGMRKSQQYTYRGVSYTKFIGGFALSRVH